MNYINDYKTYTNTYLLRCSKPKLIEIIRTADDTVREYQGIIDEIHNVKAEIMELAKKLECCKMCRYRKTDKCKACRVYGGSKMQFEKSKSICPICKKPVLKDSYDIEVDGYIINYHRECVNEVLVGK